MTKLIYHTYNRQENFENSNGITYSDNKQSITGVNCKIISPNITILETVTSIGNNLFQNCTNLTSITIPNSVKKIGAYAFASSPKLITINISPDSDITEIGEKAFFSCRILSKFIIPKNVTTIGENAFRECGSMRELKIYCKYIDLTTPKDLYVFYYAKNVNNVYLSRDFFQWRTYINKNTGGSKTYYINEDATILDDNAFNGITNMSIIIPNSVTSIGNYAFNQCASLTNITMSNNVNYIGNFAFNKCSKLTNIIIPSPVTFIGNNAFTGCSKLNTISIYCDFSLNRNIAKKNFTKTLNSSRH